MTLTAHCLVKNEENFVGYAIRSVIEAVDYVLVFDTGSTDRTVEIVRELQTEFPGKILLEEKGKCDKKRHTQLRQEMIGCTTTDWFMILDGDEVWTKRGMQEALNRINKSQVLECLIAPFYICVGDVRHYSILGRPHQAVTWPFFFPRFFKCQNGLRWNGDYNDDALVDAKGRKIFEKEHVETLKEKFWHMTHLQRSSADDLDYSSGGMSRKQKRRLTYFLIGKKITEPIPEVFVQHSSSVVQALSFLSAVKNFIVLVWQKFVASRFSR